MSNHSMTNGKTVESEPNQINNQVNTHNSTIKYAVTPKSESPTKISTEVCFVTDPTTIPEPTKPLAEILTTKELEERGLKPDEKIGTWRKVAKLSELDVLVIAGDQSVRDKWAIAPDGYYWKEFSEKCYFWFEWVELSPIPK